VGYIPTRRARGRAAADTADEIRTKCQASQDILNVAVKIHRHRQKLGHKLKNGPILKNIQERAT
jgi:hypothetical protein